MENLKLFSVFICPQWVIAIPAVIDLEWRQFERSNFGSLHSLLVSEIKIWENFNIFTILNPLLHLRCPASIFYSSLYTESLYLTLTLLGLLHLHSAGTLTRSHLVVASAIFSLAFLTRSNGLINIGFIGFQLLLDAIIVRRDGQIEFRECAMEMGKRVGLLLN
jgi:hypothetical protein